MSLATETVSQRLEQLDRGVRDALAAILAEPDASPALVAVVRELVTKSAEALGRTRGADEQTTREAVVELEQAADSAKVAAQASSEVSLAARRQVVDAHDGICALKAEVVT